MSRCVSAQWSVCVLCRRVNARTDSTTGVECQEVVMQGNDSVSPVPGLALARFLARTAMRQFRFPRFLRGVVELLMLSGVFLIAGIISLGSPVAHMLGPMVPVVFMMMLCMVASGVYRTEINNSILRQYLHSLYGFALATGGFMLITHWLPQEYSSPKFVFFFLFFTLKAI